MAGWQPIETAPRDGTVILVYANQGSTWNGIHAARPHYSGQTSGWGHDWAHANYQNLGGHISGRVTHWMPMPAPPALARPDPADVP